MKIAKGVEWASHACTILALLPKNYMLSAEALTSYHEVPTAYIAKQMQLLSKAKLIMSLRGASGGYYLAKPANEISLWDITDAIEGSAPSFKCMEIRQNGPCGAARKNCLKPCGIASKFYEAELAFRRSLQSATIADMVISAAQDSTAQQAASVAIWLRENSNLRL